MKALVWLLPTASLLLFGCGGGGSGSGAATTGTTTSVTATPTYPTLATLTSPTTFATVAAAYPFTAPLAAVPATVTASYDPSSMAYSLSATIAGSTTTISQTFTNPIEPGNYNNVVGTGPDGSTLQSYLTLIQKLSPQFGDPAVNYSYTGLGLWQVNSTSKAGVESTTIYDFAYGIGTQAGNLPLTGTATYTLELDGSAGGHPLSGPGTLTVNFSAGTATISLSPAIAYDIEDPDINNAVPIGTLTGTGTISLTTNSFSLSVSGAGYSGSVNGLFYGPQGAEIGAALALNPAVITTTNPPIVGGALGKP